jgi:AraC family transcriptional regulator
METTNVIERPETTSAFAPSRFENGAPLLLAGLRKGYTYDNMGTIPAQWGAFARHIGTLPEQVGFVTYGVVINNDDPNGFDYMSAVAVSRAPQLPPPDFTLLDVPAQRYAVFPHTGHLSTMCETIDGIYQRWFPTSGYELTGNIGLIERYGEQFDPQVGSGDIEIWVPIQG